MDLLKTSDTYYNLLFGNASASNVLSPLPGAKAKVLLLDQHTTPVVSMCYTTTQLLSNEVILVEVVEKQASLNTMKHLQCICYLKPTQELIAYLCSELQCPHYNSYQVYFNNSVSKLQLEKIAELDSYELISLVVEVFQDYISVNDNLFVTTSPQTHDHSYTKNSLLAESASITSLLLLLKKCPVIKYEPSSKDLRKLSLEILYAINSNSNNNLFDDLNNHNDSPPVLLLLDRKNDPITPLLLPWTYQSMIHELIGINKNVVKVQGEQLTLSETSDLFYKESMYLNYGDLTEKVQKYVEEYKKQTKQTSTESLKNSNLSDLKNFLIKFPEFKKFSANVSKHLNLVSELDKVINDQGLWDLGELQQIIAAGLENHHAVKLKIHQVLDNYLPPPAAGQPPQPPSHFSTPHKVKLILLYAIKYVATAKPDNETETFLAKLSNPNLTSPTPTLSQLSVIRSFKKYLHAPTMGVGLSNSNNSANHNNSTGNNSDFSSNRSSSDGLGIFNGRKLNELFNKAGGNNSQNIPDNIYMHHTPKLIETLNSILAASASNGEDGLTGLVPESVSNQYGNGKLTDSIQDIIIYIKGGVTYEEARAVHEWNKFNANTHRKINVIIGGSTILNSTQWFEQLTSFVTQAENGSNQELPAATASASARNQLRDLL